MNWDWVGRMLFNVLPFVIMVVAAFFYGRERERRRVMQAIFDSLPELPPSESEVPWDRDEAWMSGPHYPTEKMRARLEKAFSRAKPKACGDWPVAPDGLLSVYRVGQSDALAKLVRKLDAYAREQLVSVDEERS